MRSNIWVYIVLIIIIQTLCVVQVECLAANWCIGGFAGLVSHRDMLRSGESVSLLQDVVAYLKASQAEIVFIRTPRDVTGTGFGLLPAGGSLRLPILPALDATIIAPQRESDAHLREASRRMNITNAGRLLAQARATEKTGPPVASRDPATAVI